METTSNNKTTSILLSIIIILLLVGGAFWISSVEKERAMLLERIDLMQRASLEIGSATSTSNIVMIGNMVFNNPGYDKDTWYIVSERPGAAVLAYRLAFTDASECITADAQARLCQLGVKFEGGTRVYVRGFLQDNTITVQEMTLFAPLAVSTPQ